MSTKSVNTECKNLTAAELEQDAGWQAIYAQSFPPEEVESFEHVIVPGVRGNVMSALCVRDKDETMAMAAVHHLYNNDLGFLVYIAAKPGERGKGHGTAMLQYSLKIAEDRRRVMDVKTPKMVVEVDMPGQDGITADEKKKREDRIHFFESRGGLTFMPHMRYAQPPLQDGAPPVPMNLMIHKGLNGAVPDDAIMWEVVGQMFVQKYGKVNGIKKQTLDDLLKVLQHGEKLD